MAQLPPVGVIAELVLENGDMARRVDCQAFAKKHGLKIISIEHLAAYRIENELHSFSLD